LALVAGILFAAALPALGAPVALYVAPGGNDAWSGGLEAANSAKTDGPVASVGRARDLLRELRAKDAAALKDGATVTIAEGTYFLPATLVFTPADSGAANAPVRYVGRGKVVLSAGRRVSGWAKAQLNGVDLLAADVPTMRGDKGWTFRQIWVNGQRATRARFPDTGYLRVDRPIGATGKWNEGQTSVGIAPGDVKPVKDLADADCVMMCRWTESHLPLTGIDAEKGVLSFGKRSVFTLEKTDPYWLEGAPEWLNAPGEWWADRKAGKLYYVPRPGESADGLDVIAPMFDKVVQFVAKPEAGESVANLAFENLGFSHAEWYFPKDFNAGWYKPDVAGFPQAAVGVGAAVSGVGVQHTAFRNCRFVHVGGYALELSRGCSDNTIDGCEMGDLGAGGLKLGETVVRRKTEEQTGNTTLSNCHIHDGGRMFPSAVAVWLGHSAGNQLRYNDIHDFYYTGFSIGWTWGYKETIVRDNVIEFNHVHHLGRLANGDGPILSDMGGIYSLGAQANSFVRSNIFHDIAGIKYGGWGIYTDEGSGGITVEHNLVYNTTHGGFHQHYGKENVIRGNVFANARDFQIQRTRPEEHLSYTFTNNVVYTSTQPQMFGGNLDKLGVAFDNNLYFCAAGEPKFGKRTFAQWQGVGMDKSSKIADPMFVDPEKGDFRLKPGSPAAAMGLKIPTVADVGPRIPKK